MTDDDIKYHAMEHLLAQGERSFSEENGCEYRSDNGNRCAVGFFISDEDYSHKMEGKDVSGLYEAGLLPKALHRHADVLNELQALHDGAANDDFTAAFEVYFEEPYPTFRARYLANKQETVDA